MMILLTGGSGCGKSAYAEKICTHFPLPRYYIAAMRPYGPGSAEKIARHRLQRRDKGFETFERYTDFAGLVLPKRGTALLECICNVTANEMFDENGTASAPCERVLSGVEALERQCSRLVVVTNDVGSDDGNYDEATKEYVRCVGKINAALAARADTVVELVCGIPIVIKGELPL